MHLALSFKSLCLQEKNTECKVLIHGNIEFMQMYSRLKATVEEVEN